MPEVNRAKPGATPPRVHACNSNSNVSSLVDPQLVGEQRTASHALHIYTSALFRCHPNSKFFHSLSITSIFSRLHRVLNVGKKITNYTV